MLVLNIKFVYRNSDLHEYILYIINMHIIKYFNIKLIFKYYNFK